MFENKKYQMDLAQMEKRTKYLKDFCLSCFQRLLKHEKMLMIKEKLS